MPNENLPLGFGQRMRLIDVMEEAIELVDGRLRGYYQLYHPEVNELLDKLQEIRDELQQKNNTDFAALKAIKKEKNVCHTRHLMKEPYEE